LVIKRVGGSFSVRVTCSKDGVPTLMRDVNTPISSMVSPSAITPSLTITPVKSVALKTVGERVQCVEKYTLSASKRDSRFCTVALISTDSRKPTWFAIAAAANMPTRAIVSIFSMSTTNYLKITVRVPLVHDGVVPSAALGAKVLALPLHSLCVIPVAVTVINVASDALTTAV